MRSQRIEFINGKNLEQIQNDFNNLPFEDKQNLWLDKLSYLSEQNFGEEIKSNILILKDFIENFGNKEKYPAFNEATIKLAKLIPETDFNLMFASLENYEYNGSFVGNSKVSENFINQIETLKASYYIGGKTDGITSRRACTCRWCWIELGISGTSGNCAEERWGCGFLFLQTCNKTLL